MSEQLQKTKTIFLSGGGSGGSVTPLLAVAEELLKSDIQDYRLVFIGTAQGPERDMVADFNRKVGVLEFRSITGGKWRRYFSGHNIFDFFKIIFAFYQSLRLLSAEKVDLIISAGSFISVPLVWAAACKKVPILIHQQDVRPGFANRLMAPFASVISVALEKSLLDYGPRAIWIGNPVAPDQADQDALSVKEIKDKYSLDISRRLIFITGGGTGAQAVNELIFAAAPELVKSYQVIHLVGRGKLPSRKIKLPNYQVFEFLNNEEVLDLMRAADLVISRAGMSALSELSLLNKAAILIPIPNSHQEDNAAVFAQAKAAVVLKQNDLVPESLLAEIKKILDDGQERVRLSNSIGKVIKRGAAEAMAGIVWEMLGK
ncbi:MAG: glycosyltransferase [Patescibacteria group bacterium]